MPFPDETLTEIFSYVPHDEYLAILPQVCSKWNKIIGDVIFHFEPKKIIEVPQFYKKHKKIFLAYDSRMIVLLNTKRIIRILLFLDSEINHSWMTENIFMFTKFGEEKVFYKMVIDENTLMCQSINKMDHIDDQSKSPKKEKLIELLKEEMVLENITTYEFEDNNKSIVIGCSENTIYLYDTKIRKINSHFKKIDAFYLIDDWIFILTREDDILIVFTKNGNEIIMKSEQAILNNNKLFTKSDNKLSIYKLDKKGNLSFLETKIFPNEINALMKIQDNIIILTSSKIYKMDSTLKMKNISIKGTYKVHLCF